MEIVRRDHREAFITADGSSIRELAGIASGNASNQSLAEAAVPAGGTTVAHLHRRAEEIYLFTGGTGRMRLGDEQRALWKARAVCLARESGVDAFLGCWGPARWCVPRRSRVSTYSARTCLPIELRKFPRPAELSSSSTAS